MSVQTSNRCLFAREQVEPLKMRKQMTADKAGALIDDADKWNSIDWREAQRQVRRLQVRIAKAVKENRWNRVKAIQYLLTHSFYAKLLAVKRVTSNKGRRRMRILTCLNTPVTFGVVGIERIASCCLLYRPENFGQ